MSEAPAAVALLRRAPGWWECRVRVEALYGQAYWEEYRGRDRTAMGRALTAARLELVRRHGVRQIADVGVGGGAFVVAARGAGLEVCGVDVNPYAIDWLRRRGEWWDGAAVEAVSLWDAIEHMEDAGATCLARARWAFISTPVYRDEAHIRASRHFKPGQHLHYWTGAGLEGWLRELGFGLVEVSGVESELGREGIGGFVFRRLGDY